MANEPPSAEELKKVDTVVSDFCEVIKAHNLPMAMSTMAAARLCGLILSATPKSVNLERHMFLRKVLHHTIDVSCAVYSQEKPSEDALNKVAALMNEFKALAKKG